MMNSEIGFGRKVLSAFEDNGISFEHMPSGIDTMTIFVHQPEFEGKEQLSFRLSTDMHSRTALSWRAILHSLQLLAVV